MNEQQLLEAQLARERAHLMDIVAALDGRTGASAEATAGASFGTGAGTGIAARDGSIGAQRETQPASSGYISHEFLMGCEDYLMFIESLERARARTLLGRLPRAAAIASVAAATDAAARAGAGAGAGAAIVADTEALSGAIAHLQAALARCSEPPAPPRRPADAPTDERSGAPEPHVAAAHAARRAALAMQLLEARLALEASLATSYSLEDRRAVAHLDADCILEERRLYREVVRHGLEPRGA